MTWPTDDTRQDRYARVADFLMQRLTQMESYHNHKETMAHAALALLVGIMSAMVGAKCWPPNWICSGGAIAGVIIVWLIFHVYIRWQLQRRRYAAAFTNSAAATLASWAQTPPTQQQLQPHRDNLQTDDGCLHWIYLLFPIKKIFVKTDREYAHYPEDFFKEMKQEQEKCDRVGIVHECAMFVISLLILVAMLLRTLLD